MENEKWGPERGRWNRTFIRHPALAGLVVGTVLLRIGLALALPRTIKWDESSYLLLGRNLLTGRGFTTGLYPEVYHPPLYPIVSGTLYLFVGDFEQASNLAYALFGGLLLLPVFVVAQRTYGLQTAWLVTVLLAIFPALSISVLYWGTMIEPLYLCLTYGGLAALLVGLEDDRLGMFAAAGVLFGLAYLTRPEGVVYFGVFLVFGLVWLARRMNLRVLRAWCAVGWFVLSFVLLAAPYVWYLHTQTGHWMLTGKLNVAWESFGPMITHDPVAFDRLNNGLDASGREIYWLSPDRFQRSLLQTVMADPMDLVHRVVANARELKAQFFGGGVFWYGLLPLVVLALFKKPWDRRRLEHEALLVAALVPLLAFLPFGILMRYFTPAFPVLLMWTARGALDLGVWLQDTLELSRGRPVSSGRLKTMLEWLPAGVVVLFFLVMVPVVAWAGLSATFFGHKEVGLWLRTHTPPGAVVMVEELGIAVYADRRWVPSPHADWTRFIEYARAHDATHLVVDTYELTHVRPYLAFLLKTGTPELELEFSFEDSHGRTLVYYILPKLRTMRQNPSGAG
jgi:4-amino-4-deoxy-L-arabinose transferase-like glycosyltransferase